jgi:hypothetical protein
MARLLRAIAFATLASLGSATVPAQQPAQPGVRAPCDAVNGLSFICGVERPEDLARIAGTRWLIASGFSEGAGLKLIDVDAHTMRFWFTGLPAQVRPPEPRYAGCSSPPAPSIFNARGLSLRSHGKGLHTLYVVNHGGRESIEIFSVDATTDVPSLAWIGCVGMPEGQVANSVTSLPDGTILATVLIRPGTTMADYVEGRVTGAVWEWKPGRAAFRIIPGTELSGNNGIEVSHDGKKFYVVAYGLRTVFEFSVSTPSTPLRKALAPGFLPDNIHWDGDRLMAAGMLYDEPACGGIRKVIDGRAEDMYCHRGYVVGALDPDTMTFSTVAYGEPNPAFTGVSTAILIGRELWLGSFRSDRVAYRMLPY